MLCFALYSPRFDFKKSKLLFESSSNGTKSVNLVSHSMMAFDTRYAGQKSASGTPNVFNCIFQSSKNSSPGAIQIELHFRLLMLGCIYLIVPHNDMLNGFNTAIINADKITGIVFISKDFF